MKSHFLRASPKILKFGKQRRSINAINTLMNGVLDKPTQLRSSEGDRYKRNVVFKLDFLCVLMTRRTINKGEFSFRPSFISFVNRFKIKTISYLHDLTPVINIITNSPVTYMLLVCQIGCFVKKIIYQRTIATTRQNGHVLKDKNISKKWDNVI